MDPSRGPRRPFLRRVRRDSPRVRCDAPAPARCGAAQSGPWGEATGHRARRPAQWPDPDAQAVAGGCRDAAKPRREARPQLRARALARPQFLLARVRAALGLPERRALTRGARWPYAKPRVCTRPRSVVYREAPP